MNRSTRMLEMSLNISPPRWPYCLKSHWHKVAGIHRTSLCSLTDVLLRPNTLVESLLQIIVSDVEVSALLGILQGSLDEGSANPKTLNCI